MASYCLRDFVSLTFVYQVFVLMNLVDHYKSNAQLLPGNMFRFSEFPSSDGTPQGTPQEATPTRPPYEQKALTARFVVHTSDWGSLATISVQNSIKGLPYANVFSISDGVSGNFSTGVPYFFMTPLDVSAQDLEQDPSATLVVSEAQGKICTETGFDPESPVCARVMLTGFIKKVVGAREMALAREVLFSRHPIMATWEKMPTHKWFFAKLKIKQIQMLDFYGGISHVTPEDYYKANLY